MLVDMLLLITPVATLLLTLAVLSYYLPRLIKLNKRIQEASDIIENIVIELRNRLNNQDKKIIDHEVKVEIMDLRLTKSLQPSLRESSIMKKVIKEEKEMQKEIKSSNKLLDIKEKLTDTEEEILKILLQKEYTATELQAVINKTREHTSRMLKKLFKYKYIERDERKRPYVYRLVRDNISTSV
jgi:predicted transcriptional regulator